MNVVPYRTMAMFKARKMVKEDIRRKGHKLSDYKLAQIEVMARMYLELHPELAKHAKEDVDRLILDGGIWQANAAGGSCETQQ